jgi:glucosylglycerate synthase
VEVDSATPQASEKTEQIESADLIVGILADIGKEDAEALVESLQSLSGSPRIVVLQNEPPASTAAPTHPPDEKHISVSVIPWREAGGAPAGAPADLMSSAYRSVLTTSEKLSARACCVLASTFEAGALNWVNQLTRALLEEDFDLVSPYYARRKFDGLLNSSIVYPLTRCLYGKRIHNPMGPDLGISRRLFQSLQRSNANSNSSLSPLFPLPLIAPKALCSNLKVGQAHVGARAYTPTDWTNVSPTLTQVLGPLFSEIEKNAACWQRTRDSVPIPEFGQPVPVSQESAKPDTGRMVDSFHLANRDLQEIWRLVLPPATLFDLSKLARLPADDFRMPDEVWARIVYDFALAHRLRTINRDHLLSSMTPLYLGWVASYAREADGMDAPAIERRLERLCVAYESSRPYLVSRWRWPDRFNP